MSATKENYNTLEAQPKERPILFTTDMVRAIIEGRKAQTRRIIKHIPIHTTAIWHDGGEWIIENEKGNTWNGKISCLYGHPGDHLYVRETWAQFGGIYYFKTNEPQPFGYSTLWRPSIHMPRAAARLHLQITDIRAQRLHDITETDAIAEGIHYTTPNSGPNRYYDNYHTGRWMEPEMLNNPIASYRTLWEKINGPGSWLENPWVWVITFKKV